MKKVNPIALKNKNYNLTQVYFISISAFYCNNAFVIYCVCFIYENKKHVFYGNNSVKDFFIFLSKNRIVGIVFSYNLTYEGALFLNYLKSNNINNFIEGMYFNNEIYGLIIKNSDFAIQLKSFFKIFPVSLSDMASVVNLNNLIMDDVDINQFNYLNEEKKKKSILCNLNKIIIIKKITYFIKSLIDVYDVDIFYNIFSISNLAFTIFLKKFNKYANLLFLKKEEEDLFRNFYYGGRCEVFGNPRNEEFIHYFDFTSMYATVMHDFFCFGNFSIKNVSTLNGPGFYKVEIQSDLSIPVLPYKIDKEGKTFFPNGSWIGIYWWEELELFLKNGGIIKKILLKYEFDRYERPFYEFLQEFQNKKIKNKFERSFWKLFINSLSGRIGMKKIEKKTMIIDKSNYYYYRKTFKITNEVILDKIVILTYEKDSIYSKTNVTLALTIASKARVRLYKAFLDCIKHRGRLLYCDTDSIFAAFPFNNSLQRNGEILWNKNDIKDAVFALPKSYALKYENNELVKIKGCSFPTDFEKFKNIFYNDKKEFLIFKESIFYKSNLILEIEEIEKKILLNAYDKRTFNKEKTTTTPITI